MRAVSGFSCSMQQSQYQHHFTLNEIIVTKSTQTHMNTTIFVCRIKALHIIIRSDLQCLIKIIVYTSVTV
jgi:hypothetical protein